MKYLLIIFSLLFTLVSWSNEVDYDDLYLEIKDGLYYKKYSSNKPYTGKVIGEKQGMMENGKQQGAWIWYDSEGILEWKINYKDGKYDGKQHWYDENGELMLTEVYKEGKIQFQEVYFYEDGKLVNTIKRDGDFFDKDKVAKRLGNFMKLLQNDKFIELLKNDKLLEILENDKFIQSLEDKQF